jgi:hypothetical protein
MNRRIAIRNVVLLSAGAVFMPSCLSHERPSVVLKNFQLTNAENNLLAQLADTLIPKTSFIGASDLKAHEFVLTMVDDCYSPEEQQKFVTGLKTFDNLATRQLNQPFTKSPANEKLQWLAIVESKKDMPEDLLAFYDISKKHIIQRFTSSKPFLIDIRNYKIIPGSQYKGCVAMPSA